MIFQGLLPPSFTLVGSIPSPSHRLRNSPASPHATSGSPKGPQFLRKSTVTKAKTWLTLLVWSTLTMLDPSMVGYSPLCANIQGWILLTSGSHHACFWNVFSPRNSKVQNLSDSADFFSQKTVGSMDQVNRRLETTFGRPLPVIGGPKADFRNRDLSSSQLTRCGIESPRDLKCY